MTKQTKHDTTGHNTPKQSRGGGGKKTHKGKKGKALNQEWNSTGIKELTENQTKVKLKDWRKLKLKKLTKVKIRDEHKWSLKVTGNTARLKLKDQNNWSKVKLKVKGNQIRVELKNLNN